MAQLSEWLQLMLAEIARKQEEAQRASDEHDQRQQEAGQSNTPATSKYLSTQA